MKKYTSTFKFENVKYEIIAIVYSEKKVVFKLYELKENGQYSNIYNKSDSLDSLDDVALDIKIYLSTMDIEIVWKENTCKFNESQLGYYINLLSDHNIFIKGDLREQTISLIRKINNIESVKTAMYRPDFLNVISNRTINGIKILESCETVKMIGRFDSRLIVTLLRDHRDNLESQLYKNLIMMDLYNDDFGKW